MNYIVSISLYSSKKSSIVISEKLAGKLGLKKKKRGIVSFGTEKKYVDISISQVLDETGMFLSSGIIDDLHIPDYPIFEVQVNGNEIVIGPCIGILVAQEDKDITKRRLKEISMSMLDYQTIRGAVIVFSLDKVDQSKRLLQGYCYNPKTDSWERGIFPYPLAIHRKTSLNDEWQNHFLSVIGDRVFNNYTFGKWEMYRWFSEEIDILPNLPHTILYKSYQDMYDMLQKYGVLYVKPIWGMKGHGVVRIIKENDKIVFKYRKDDENINISSENKTEVEKTIEKLFKPGEYIIQQGLDMIEYNGGVVDFRCVMQKNHARQWVCNAIVARAGAKGSVVSNISSGGGALPALELVKEVFSITEREVFSIKEKIISLCMKVCRSLDEYGINYCTLGLDIGIDKKKNIWLIEVNNRSPHPAIALRVNEILSYYTILASPLHYAKSLAGFGCKEEDINVL